MSEDFPGRSLTANPIAQPLRPDVVTVLKRPASLSFEGLEENTCRKRVKEDVDDAAACQSNGELTSISNTIQFNLVEELAQELQCGCCTELVYRPVVVSPCQHFFCGR
jgi:E3 ubiquitin-protein ligase CHFR